MEIVKFRAVLAVFALLFCFGFGCQSRKEAMDLYCHAWERSGASEAAVPPAEYWEYLGKHWTNKDTYVEFNSKMIRTKSTEERVRILGEYLGKIGYSERCPVLEELKWQLEDQRKRSVAMAEYCQLKRPLQANNESDIIAKQPDVYGLFVRGYNQDVNMTFLAMVDAVNLADGIERTTAFNGYFRAIGLPSSVEDYECPLFRVIAPHPKQQIQVPSPKANHRKSSK
ncbi:MAG: hypothetical protein GY822_10500 [Deltaproteobacteria bacterium]|nr:hypothetical protein [Deltaproteobacteria bacterium]